MDVCDFVFLAGDYYYYNPWRAPGSAPVFDSCGMAGGSPLPVSNPQVGVRFQNTSLAQQGDLGSSVLPTRNTNTTWVAGELAEVSWTVRTNHGGGYQYRLCPASEPLTEECFQKHPLPFEGKSSLRWGGKENGKQLWFDGTFVSEGTIPVGSMYVPGASLPVCALTSRLSLICDALIPLFDFLIH